MLSRIAATIISNKESAQQKLGRRLWCSPGLAPALRSSFGRTEQTPVPAFLRNASRLNLAKRKPRLNVRAIPIFVTWKEVNLSSTADRKTNNLCSARRGLSVRRGGKISAISTGTKACWGTLSAREE